MNEQFYVLQDFLTFTEGVTYTVVVASLVFFVFFWRFLSARDSDE